jgi:23S rRNA A1618 N6-methylase RlmF
MAIIVLKIKLKMDKNFKNTHYSIIPPFHYSMIEAKTQTSKYHIFSLSCRNSETFNYRQNRARYQAQNLECQCNVKVIVHIMVDQNLPHAKSQSKVFMIFLCVLASLRENLIISP